MSKLSPARKLALDVLMEADRRGMYARDVLSSRASAKAIDQRDSAFAARLALGVAATQGILDELLDQFLDKPKKVAPRVRMALRISAFEMLYLHTPGRVAVSQGVELVRSGAKSAAGLANAVLHKVADNVRTLPRHPTWMSPSAPGSPFAFDGSSSLAVRSYYGLVRYARGRAQLCR